VNRDFKYGLQGLLLAIAFLAIIKFVIFLFEKPGESSLVNGSVNTDIAPIDLINTLNENGKKLFEKNCAVCHPFNLDGPSIANVQERVKNRKLLYEYIRNSKKVIESGDPYFTQVYESYNKVSMPSFPNLSDTDIQDILDYFNLASLKEER
jgi:cytochrome c